MATVRKGLSLFNENATTTLIRHQKPMGKMGSQKQQPVSSPHVKAPVASTKLTEKKKTSSFKIFRDPVSQDCQHCGSANRNTEATTAVTPTASNTSSCGVQVSDVNINEWLCGENPPEGYWQEVAEQRRVALKETLDENRELCDLVEALNKEIERLGKIDGQAEQFCNSYQMLKKDTEISL